jgi:hypothetical protein
LIDILVVVQKSDIRSEVKFRSIRTRIFDIADSQIPLYKKIENEEFRMDDEDEEVQVGWEEAQIDGWDDSIESESDSEEETQSEDEKGDEEVQSPNACKDPRILKGYLFGMEELRLLKERLTSRGDFLLKYELFGGHLVVRAVPGLPHEMSAMYFNNELTDWSMIPGAQRNNK